MHFDNCTAWVRCISARDTERQMRIDSASRRAFLQSASAATAAMLTSHLAAAQGTVPAGSRQQSGVEVLRNPDFITTRFGPRALTPMQHSAREWTGGGVRVTAEPAKQGLPVMVAAETARPTHLHLRWVGKPGESIHVLGDQWERSYGDLEWRGVVPNRVMPWYFITFDGHSLNGYGVATQPSAFCFWQQDPNGITLTVDLRSGGEPVALGQRPLHACTVVTRQGARGEPLAAAARGFCSLMYPAPRLPKGALFGSNDWNYAYGKNTAAGILRDADLITSLAPHGNVKPYVVIDDGYQDAVRFPSMPDLASGIRERHLRPGLWIRPLRAPEAASPKLLLPQTRLGKSAGALPAFDPTTPEALEQILETVRTPVRWGYEFIKHDFSTVELFGQWGSEMTMGPARPGWSFNDRSRTNAEIVRDLYLAILQAAGEQTVILGCNTVGHIAAGIFESQRIADDTSGRDWERTRRFGVNGLAQRIAQHRTFFHIDPDCVALTREVGWRETSQWMDVVSRSGTSLFFSPEPDAITPDVNSAMRDAMAVVSQNASGYPTDPLEGTTPGQWKFERPVQTTRQYDWCDAEGILAFPV